MLVNHFKQTLDIWINALDDYQLARLCIKPSPTAWSLGQLYFHLIKNTEFYLEQVEICLSTDDHLSDQPSQEAVEMFERNEFPNEIIEGPDTDVDFPQPKSSEELRKPLAHLKEQIQSLAYGISNRRYSGKTKHPGLGYFNAYEWLQFAEMHLRHHLRQKKRIEDFLNTLH